MVRQLGIEVCASGNRIKNSEVVSSERMRCVCRKSD